MQRYYLFGGQYYYPNGGVRDFRSSVRADSVVSARKMLDFSGLEWWQIVLIEDGVVHIVASGYTDRETELEEAFGDAS